MWSSKYYNKSHYKMIYVDPIKQSVLAAYIFSDFCFRIIIKTARRRFFRGRRTLKQHVSFSKFQRERLTLLRWKAQLTTTFCSNGGQQNRAEYYGIFRFVKSLGLIFVNQRLHITPQKKSPVMLKCTICLQPRQKSMTRGNAPTKSFLQ